MKLDPIYGVSTILVIITFLLAIFAFSFSSVGAGLENDERAELNQLKLNISVLKTESELLLMSVEPLQSAIDNTSETITGNKLRDIPTLEQCESSLGSFYPIIQNSVDVLNAGLDTIDLTRLAILVPLVDSAESLVQTLANDFSNTGQVDILQEGTFFMSNADNLVDEYVNMTYSLRQMRFPGGARLYFIQIPPSPENLLIQTVTGVEATVVFWGWFPPLLLGGLTQTPTEDAILDAQRVKIQATPTPVIFNQRRYDLQNGRIEIVDTGRNFTSGDVVRVFQTIELNVGYL